MVFFKNWASALDRMSELAMLAQDETKTDADRALYDKEFQKLDDFITAIKDKDFNGVSLFHNGQFDSDCLHLMEQPWEGAVNVAGSADWASIAAASNSGVATSSCRSRCTDELSKQPSAPSQTIVLTWVPTWHAWRQKVQLLAVLKDNISAAVAVLVMWMWLKRVPTLPVSRSWFSPERPCWLRPMCCRNPLLG